MNSLIPENETGRSLDLEHSVTTDTEEDAMAIFIKSCNKLQHPETWHELTGTLGANFTSKDKDQNDKQRNIQINDYLQIDIPAPGTAAGNGHDWVQVKKIDKNFEPGADESFGIILQVSANPAKPEEGVAHFFGDGATSSFIIKRKGNIVTASYHGRNEKPNTDNSGIGDKIRNTVVALGAMAGISDLQWTALLKGLLEN